MIDGAPKPAPSRRRSKAVLIIAAVVVLVSLAGGATVLSQLSGGGFDAAGTRSAKAADVLREKYDATDPDAVLLVTAREGDVDTPAMRRYGSALVERLSRLSGVDRVTSYWGSPGAESFLRSRDGSKALVAVSLNGDTNDKSKFLRELGSRVDLSSTEATISVGGGSEVFRAIQDQIVKDLAVSEAVAVAISLILLLMVFRSVGASLLPLAMGIISASVTLLVLNVLAHLTEVSIFALNLTSALALGLGIDYGLLMVSRFREELGAGRTVPDAVRVTRATAGRTVVFSGLTVALALGSLLVIPLPFLRSFAYAAVPVVLVAVVAAVVVLPAALALLGHRIDWLPLRRLPRISPSDDFFARAGRWSIRHRLPVAALAIVGLSLLALPFLHIQIGKSDERVLRPGADIRATQSQISNDFPTNSAYPITVLVGRGEASSGQVEQTASRISSIDGIGAVTGPSRVWVAGRDFAPAAATPQEGTYWRLTAVYGSGVDPYTDTARTAVTEIRDLTAPADGLVGGETARLMDTNEVIADRLPWALLLILLTSLILIFLLTGSLVVPIKAVVLTVLSLSATFGVMVWGFQDGHLEGLLGFTSPGYLDNAMPVLIFCTAFGLSMDYELFLVSRIHEEFRSSGDNDLAIERGLRHTGGVFTSAALLLAVVFAGLLTSHASLIQMAGLGIVLAILLDATVIRCLVVPALMSLMGRANWWAPRPLRSLHRAVGLQEPAAQPHHVEQRKTLRR